MDPILFTFLHASKVESDDAINRLLTEHAEPVIKGIVNAKLQISRAGLDSRQAQDANDIYQDVLVEIIARLHACKSEPENKAITDFRSYVAVVSYNSCSQRLRQKYPHRWRLKNRLRYFLTHQPKFALWEAREREWFCGLATWQNEKTARATSWELQQLRLTSGLKLPRNTTESLLRANLDNLLTSIFTELPKPLELDDLVSLIVELQGIKDPITVETEEEPSNPGERLTTASVATEVEQRFYLKRLWAEICQLPLRQRVALLLNLRGAHGGDSIELFPLLGIASIRQIAETVVIRAEEFAGLWNRLPFDDEAIAERLGCTRQQVINLRKCARDRLARRMRDF